MYNRPSSNGSPGKRSFTIATTRRIRDAGKWDARTPVLPGRSRCSSGIVCVVNGQFVETECKAPKGRQSKAQKELQRQLEAAAGSTSWRIRLMKFRP
jgi:hypothetical protein